MSPVYISDVNRIPTIVDALDFYLEKVYRKILSRVHWWIQEIFRTQGPDNVIDPVNDVVYHRWMDTKRKTREAKKGEKVILIDTGIMRNSIQIVDDIVEERHYEGRIGIFIGPATNYSRIHEFGGTIVLNVREGTVKGDNIRRFFLAMFLEEKRGDPYKPFADFEWKPLKKETTEMVIRMPQRSFLRKGMIRATPDVVDLVHTVVWGVLSGQLE